mgnify:CR=1 FL=1
MIVLTIDTCGENCSLELNKNGELFVKELSSNESTSENLLVKIEDLLIMANTNSSSVRKPTKKQMFEGLLKMPGLSQEQIDFINHELELLSKKNSADKKPTAQQTANEAIKVAILDNMAEGKMYTITDLIKSVPECADLTNQRVSALVRQLVDDKVVVRTEDKRKAYFSLA